MSIEFGDKCTFVNLFFPLNEVDKRIIAQFGGLSNFARKHKKYGSSEP